MITSTLNKKLGAKAQVTFYPRFDALSTLS